MRLKNNPKALDIVNSSRYIKREMFDQFDLEIGVGKGDFIINMALKYPEINFVGIEKYASVLVQAVKKVENMEIPNLKFVLMDASNIDFKNVSTLYLNFSDPWPKKRHAKRRLTSPEFLKKYDNIFSSNPHIILKTDNRNFFEYSVVSLSNYGYKINDICLDLYSSNIDNVPTEYETKFHNNGSLIYRVEACLDKKFTVK